MDADLKSQAPKLLPEPRQIIVTRYFNSTEFPDGSKTERRYITRLDSLVSYTVGCSDLMQPGIVFLLGPHKGELPIRAEVIIEQSNSVNQIILAIVNTVLNGNVPPVAGDTVRDNTGRQYVVTNSQFLIDSVKTMLTEIDTDNAHDYQIDPIVFIPVCGDDKLIFAHTSKAIH